MKKNLVFYTYPSCTSCRRTKAWLKEHNITFEERHLFRETPNIEELLNLIKLTTEGIDEILATRSQSYRELNIDIESLRVTELLKLMTEEPRLLKRPILTDGEKLIVGFDKGNLKKLENKKLLFNNIG
ncbi:Spx/MgsR family RNA polymerase-binding regulatory protein [Bacillus taeanensis]|uniref:Transcriptional regulator n=1 Tax=Bacillus taeanensis TaxID=273032 RepID=A0A366Y2F5_9BACI|nr:Spx/MgsR family RNA polymerase-binding regulatory protein [Bacillus taeanensis]RBW70574.1 transcriptional regulator [Bacillus taeanensis]